MGKRGPTGVNGRLPSLSEGSTSYCATPTHASAALVRRCPDGNEASLLGEDEQALHLAQGSCNCFAHRRASRVPHGQSPEERCSGIGTACPPVQVNRSDCGFDRMFQGLHFGCRNVGSAASAGGDDPFRSRAGAAPTHHVVSCKHAHHLHTICHALACLQARITSVVGA